jgi:hypothetical protein
MSRAVVGAGGALASFALISIEALALTGATVAHTTSSTLSILVATSVLIGSIDPSELERTDAVRAVTSIVSQTHSPIIIAYTKSTLADTVSTA